MSDERPSLLDKLAPCGLNCRGCLAFSGGGIHNQARALKLSLGGHFSVYAERLKSMNPVFREYEGFKIFLEFLSQGSCTGCRNQGCLFAACKVRECIREKGVDFCFQCGEFPCREPGMPKGLAERWRKNNERMAAEGAQAYYEGIKDKPRYP